MKIGIIGSGDVGRALGKGFAGVGHEVKIGSREPHSEKLVSWVTEVGGKTSTGTFSETAAFGEVLVICALGTAIKEILDLADIKNFKGKVVIDTTNPLDFSKGMPPSLFVSGNNSLGEMIQGWLPEAKVVKAFNIVGNPMMVNPTFEQGDPDMLISGNDPEAKKVVTDILKSFGWKHITDLGGIEKARLTEPLSILWVLYGSAHNNWHIAFKMLTK